MEPFENNETQYEPREEISAAESQPIPETVEPQPAPVMEAPVEKPKKKSGKGFVKSFVAVVLVLALVAGSGVATAWYLTKQFDARLAQQNAQWQSQLDALEQQKQETKPGITIEQGSAQVVTTGQTPAQVYENNVDKVVLIKAQVAASGYSSGGTSTGSGFILTADGYVVTNYHVVESGTKLFVVTAENAEYEAKLVGYDKTNDVALLKVEAENLPAVTLGDSDALSVGDQVVAIGNPLGELTSTLTVGYVSAKERDVNTSGFAINMLQTDAAINSGNSGGPLFDMAGQVVGITTAKYSGSSSSGATIEGIGFAIPINDVAGLLEDLAVNGYVTSPYLGVSVSDMDAAAADYYGMPMGAYVNEVVPGFCADTAGVQPKDIITAVGEHTVGGVNDLSRALRNYEPGDVVELTVFRSGAEKKLKVKLDEKPREEEQEPLQELPQQNENDWIEGLLPGLG